MDSLGKYYRCASADCAGRGQKHPRAMAAVDRNKDERPRSPGKANGL